MKPHTSEAVGLDALSRRRDKCVEAIKPRYVVRLAVDTRHLKPWASLKSLSRMPAWIGAGLKNTIRQMGSNTRQSRDGLLPVPAWKWEVVETQVASCGDRLSVPFEEESEAT
ncbi:MAG TPA: hypothetical protein VLY23_05405 [Candidatus Acidoferrum sp.]|nr:hypothetical protein [Candidatus Acidoferrum sp.]